MIIKIKITGFLLLDSPLEHFFCSSFMSHLVKPRRNTLDIYAKLLVVPPPRSVTLLCSFRFSSLAASLPDRKTLSGLEPHPLELCDLPLTAWRLFLSPERLVSLPSFSVCLLKRPRRSLKKRILFRGTRKSLQVFSER